MNFVETEIQYGRERFEVDLPDGSGRSWDG